MLKEVLSFDPNPLYFRYSRTDESRMWNCEEMDRKSPTAWPSITSTGRREKLCSPNSSNPNKIYPERDASTLKKKKLHQSRPCWEKCCRLSVLSFHVSVCTLNPEIYFPAPGWGWKVWHFGTRFILSCWVCTTWSRDTRDEQFGQKISNWLRQKSDFSFSSLDAERFPGRNRLSAWEVIYVRQAEIHGSREWLVLLPGWGGSRTDWVSDRSGYSCCVIPSGLVNSGCGC